MSAFEAYRELGRNPVRGDVYELMNLPIRKDNPSRPATSRNRTNAAPSPTSGPSSPGSAPRSR
jgi:hypothetical protein